jgi:uncharacterized DUF497 family protein
MKFVLTFHAQEELKKRGISLQLVQTVITSPEQILEEDGLLVY